jgi:hypothetical protein
MAVTGSRHATQHNRLGFNDDMFLRIERVLGTPMVNQIAWRFDRPLTELGLEEFCDGLAAGPLSRLVVRSKLPAVRDKWIPAPASDRQLRVRPAIAAAHFRAWIDQASRTRVDPEVGPPWVVEAVPLEGGGTAVSLLVSHVICDGSVLLPAIDAAATGKALPCMPDEAAPYPGLRADLADGLAQLRDAGVGLRSAWQDRQDASAEPKTAVSGRSRSGGKRAPGAAAADLPVRAPNAIADLATDAWDAAAQSRGGTRNTLLIAFTASLWAATGVVAEGSLVNVAMPVATRTDGDRRANTTVGVQVPVVLTSDRYADLTPVRVASRDAFKRRAAGVTTNPIEPFKPLMQMLPDLVVEKLASGAGDAGCTCSNVDQPPEGLIGLGGAPARTIVMRTVTQNLTLRRAKRLGPGLTSWLSVPGDRISMCIQSLDLDRVPDDAALRGLVEAELSRWDLAATVW